MAENKKSIIVYADWIVLFESLSNEEAGLLIKHFFRYVNDLKPIAPDRITELSFIPIKQALKRDLDKWESTLEERSINGRKGNLKKYNLDLYIEFEAGKYTLEQAEQIAKTRKASLPDSSATKTLANVADNVNDNVNVNDIKKENNIEQRKLKFASTLKSFVDIYGRDLIKEFYDYWTEPNKSNTKFKQELEKTWSLERRLETWAKNDINFNKQKNGKSNVTDTEQFKNLTKTIRSTGDRI
jgi:hypothetical protein